MVPYAEIGLSLAAAVLLCAVAYRVVQVFQAGGYRVRELNAWFKADGYGYFKRYFYLAFLSSLCMCLYTALFGGYGYFSYIGFAAFVFFCVTFRAVTAKESRKTPLKFTFRAVRLYAVTFIINAGTAFCAAYFLRNTVVRYSLVGVTPLLQPFVLTAAGLILYPLESLNRLRYVIKAKRKLKAMPDLIKIGITGSWGKTTLKNILAAFLSAEYKVCASPESFNTPMGLCKTVNGKLSAEHNVLIAEMGARYVGDVKELVSIVKPDIAVITAVGKQHLSTFRTLENIAKTKYEIVEGLSENGLAVFNGFDAGASTLSDRFGGRKITVVPECVSDERYGADGCFFTLTLSGRRLPVRTKLLGAHIPALIALAARIADFLKVSHEKIISAAAELKPVPHRLEPLEREGLIIIDDAYNSNPAGARAALETLARFIDRTRVIITPGIIELGEAAEEENTRLGGLAASVCHAAVLIGKNAEYIKNGLIEKGFDAGKIIFAASLEDGVSKLKDIEDVNGSKAVLFENDLPDTV